MKTVELRLKDIENKFNVYTPDWILNLYCILYDMTTNMFADRMNHELTELNEKAKQLGLKGSFDLDDPYNEFMRNENQRIADEFMSEMTGGSKVYSGNGMECSFKIEKDFMWHMYIRNETCGLKQELYPVELEES